ncbi:rRNA-processing protein las1 [Coemansia brasiliensis]|uniref:rRNA-processing protein las1 n=1 Tax=Coemansia brasiliensis TaxID=2650707 RepID=A0A9W8I5U5_9FUNG|nr:rRNA-processing protein las1 [Coemansia brasiliensis]
MTRVPKIVPWTSTEEYVGVGECLYSQELSEQKRGVAVVKAWRARARVPPAIDATANLVEAMIADHELGVSISQLRHMYSMVLIRFVNSIVDLEQKGVYAQSMASLASRIGMPAWFVELRHACTHEQIPSLAVLRSTCTQALHWLDDYYWKKQSRTLPADTMDRIRAATSDYILAYQAVKSLTHGSGADAPEAVAFETAKASLKKLLEVLHSDAMRLYVVPVLLEPGFLVPEDKRQRAKFPECAMPPGLTRQWTSLFRLLSEVWSESLIYEELLAGILSALLPESSELGIFETSEAVLSTSHAAMLVAWIRWILAKHYTPDNAESSTVSIDSLLETCLRNPGYYSRAVLKVVSEIDSRLKRELKPFVDFMGKALAALVAADSKPKKNVTFSEAALKEEENMMQQRLNSVLGPGTESMDIDAALPDPSVPGVQPAANRWSLVPYDLWSPCPIGTLSDGNIPALDLPAYLDDIPLKMEV